MGAASHFNPPAPCGAGRAAWLLRDCGSEISIHPPRAGRDAANLSQITTAMDFNPPAPCGAGRIGMGPTISQHRISIHPPRAGRDQESADDKPPFDISIHPPRAGRDIMDNAISGQMKHFNPPAPCGAGLRNSPLTLSHARFQSTRPVRGGTTSRTACLPEPGTFQSTRPVRGGTSRPPKPGMSAGYFNPPAPCGAGPRVITIKGGFTNISIHPPRAGRDW